MKNEQELSKLNNQIEDLEKEAKVNITKALEVKELSEQLNEKAVDIVMKSEEFEKHAHHIEYKTWLRANYMYFILIVVLAVLGVVLYLLFRK
eukprot:GAHX01001260.1.p1 GENE.GAHX01001260.1~~GAHX01001260.1.p1  ORF type:complete len:105 (-),score=28.04 GAHX01001260.1:80-355(-)